MNQVVLVAVLKNWRDFKILLHEHWYHLPKNYAPKKQFKYLAFYQPLSFGRAAKRIGFYGKVKKIETKKRIELFPKQKQHPQKNADYLKITIQKLVKLKNPVKNIIPRRIIFGFTTLKRLRTAHNILELYNIAPTEQIIEAGLIENNLKFNPQFLELIDKKRRFRLDFAIFCKNGKIAIECDNKKAHQLKQQQIKDKIKDKILRSRGWKIIRLRENQILDNLENCLNKIKITVLEFGGQ